MPAKKSSTPVVSRTKTAPKASTRAATPASPPKKAPAVTLKTPAKAATKAAPAKKTAAKAKPEAELLEETAAKKKAGRPAKASLRRLTCCKRISILPTRIRLDGPDVENTDCVGTCVVNSSRRAASAP